MMEPFASHRRRLPCHRERGFTIVEMMVTLIVLAILAGLAVPSMKNFIDSNKTMAFNQQVQALLQFARTQAVMAGAASGKGYVGLCQRDGTGGTKQLIVQRLALGDTTCDGNSTDLLRIIDVPLGIVVNTSPSDLIAKFNRNGTLVQAAGSGSGASNQASLVTCLNQDFRNGFTVKVFSTGRIQSGIRGEQLGDEGAASTGMTSCVPGDA